MERKHELLLMEIGAQALLRALFPKKTKAGKKVRKTLRKKYSGRKWTKEQHEKYAATMEKKWGQKRSKK